MQESNNIRQQLADLQQESQTYVDLGRKRNDASHEMLAERLYSNPLHFITELLQNAEDEEATSVEFRLMPDSLEFEHNGNLFQFADIRAIANFGDNEEKREKPNTIGRFGIGFKSVYAVTKSPRICSGPFDVTILDYVVPHDNEPESDFGETTISLPFNHAERTPDQLFDTLASELRELRVEYLLFLHNIKEIHWKIGAENGSYKRTEASFNKSGGRATYRHLITQHSTKAKETKRFVLFSKEAPIAKKQLTVQLAYRMAEHGQEIVPVSKSPLFVFFPTSLETNVSFLVHAPYHTTPARDNLHARDQRNEELTKALKILFCESLPVLRQMGMLSVRVLAMLPVNKNDTERSKWYQIFFHGLIDTIKKKEKLLPDDRGNFTSAESALISRGNELVKLLKPVQLKKLYARSTWLNREITNDRFPDLRTFLMNELGIPEVRIEDFAGKLDKIFLESQTDKWIADFYQTIHNVRALWRKTGSKHSRSVLLVKEIIRSSNGEQVIPFDENGHPNIFLPGNSMSDYPTVKKNITKKEGVRAFLIDLGLTEPDLYDEINTYILPELTGTEVYPKYYDHFKKIVEALSRVPSEKRTLLVSDLKDLPFIAGRNLVTGAINLYRADELYEPTEALKVYFKDNQNIVFFHVDSLTNKTISSQALSELLKEIGVKDYPRRMIEKDTLSADQKDLLRSGGEVTYDIECIDYKFTGLGHFFKQDLTPERSMVLWEILLKCREYDKSGFSESFFFGKYTYMRHTRRTIKFDSIFLNQLRSESWLVTVDNEWVSPVKTTIDNISDKYSIVGANTYTLASILNFKPNEVQDFEQRYGVRVVSQEEFELFQQLKEQQRAQEDDTEGVDEEEEFEPEVTPGEIDSNVSDLEDAAEVDFDEDQLNPTDDSDEPNPEDEPEKAPEDSDDDNSSDDDSDSTPPKPNVKKRKQIGDWGEDYVANTVLKEEFEGQTGIEIIPLNEPGKTGVGCDIVVKKDGEIIRLVEVKSTTSPRGTVQSISGTQWEIARKKYGENTGDLYFIYAVFNAGTEDCECVRVKNPIAKWKEGKLRAHPVNFEIR